MKRWPTVALIYACTVHGWSATLNGAITWWGWDISTLRIKLRIFFTFSRPPSENRYHRSKLFRVFASLLLGIASHAMSIILAVLSCQFFFAIQTNWNSKWIAFSGPSVACSMKQSEIFSTGQYFSYFWDEYVRQRQFSFRTKNKCYSHKTW